MVWKAEHLEDRPSEEGSGLLRALEEADLPPEGGDEGEAAETPRDQ